MRFLLALFMGLMVSNHTLADQYLGLPPLSIPADNPQTAEKIALGRSLFNDKRLSADGSVSCSSCHRNDKAFTDGLPVAIGIGGQAGTRNTPSVLNAAFYQTQFLDGRESSLETQSLGPLTNPIEQGLNNHQSAVDVVRQNSKYVQQFKQAF